jgi:serine/threonine protein kinase
VLKTVRPDLAGDADVVAAFEREIDVTARLDHPHVVRHVAHGLWQGVQMLAVEHIRGVTLAELVSRTLLPVDQALVVAEDIARALAYVHGVAGDDDGALGIVHGDVSPENIMIDDAGCARLIDFGSASTRASPRPEGVVVGKPGFVSPEQARGERVDARSDQYALGVVLWELLAGRPLFAHDGAAARVVRPLSFFTSVDDGIEAAVVRMLAEDRDARFATMDMVADVVALGSCIDTARARARLAALATRGDVTRGDVTRGDATSPDDRNTRPMRIDG